VKVEIRETAFDPHAELVRHQATMARHGKFGAMVSFIGTMRDFNDGVPVRAMTLEHYSGMTEKYIARISEEAHTRWDIVDTLIIHRVGALLPNEPIVAIGVWAAHRDAAFAACRYLIEELKAQAPFWKKEQTERGERWLDKKVSARARGD